MSEARARKRRRTWRLTLVMLAGGVLTLAAVALYPAGYFYQALYMFSTRSYTYAFMVGEGHLLHQRTERNADLSRPPPHRELIRRSEAPQSFVGFRWWFRRIERPTSSCGRGRWRWMR